MNEEFRIAYKKSNVACMRFTTDSHDSCSDSDTIQKENLDAVEVAAPFVYALSDIRGIDEKIALSDCVCLYTQAYNRVRR